MSDIFPFSAILDFLRDILMQAWLCLAVVLRPIVGDTIVDAFPFIMGGTLVTVGSVALALGMGLVLGVPMAVLQVYGNALARRLVGLYVWFFRGVPILVLLFLSQGLFLSMGWILEPFLLSCLVMGCISTAYQSQIFRGAIESLPQGQLKAARALGMRDCGCIDLIWDGAQARVMETNVSPGMTETSLFPAACKAGGLSLSAVLNELVSNAKERGAVFC